MIPAAPPIDIRDDIKITVGVVTATDVRASGGTIERGASHAHLHMGHVVWLEDKDGKEHVFEGGAFSDARKGHQVIVVQRRSSGKVLRVCNQATKSRVDRNDLIPLSSEPSELLLKTIFLTGLLFIPGFVASITIGSAINDAIGASSLLDYSWHVTLVLLILAPTMRWLTGKWATRSQANVQELSDFLDELFAQHGLTG